MKTIIILFFIILTVSTSVFAEDQEGQQNPIKPQTQTLLNRNSDISFSGYGGFTVGTSRIKNTWTAFQGFRGGLIINGTNHGVVLGFAGYGLTYPTNRETLYEEEYPEDEDHVGLGYGGFQFEYHYKPRSLIHFSFATLIGSGGIAYFDSLEDGESDNGNEDDGKHEDHFFIIEPEITMYINIAKFCRLGIGATYTIPYGIDTDGLSDSDFRSFGARAMLEFGWF